jgi:hypothetical protein
VARGAVHACDDLSLGRGKEGRGADVDGVMPSLLRRVVMESRLQGNCRTSWWVSETRAETRALRRCVQLAQGGGAVEESAVNVCFLCSACMHGTL